MARPDNSRLLASAVRPVSGRCRAHERMKAGELDSAVPRPILGVRHVAAAQPAAALVGELVGRIIGVQIWKEIANLEKTRQNRLGRRANFANWDSQFRNRGEQWRKGRTISDLGFRISDYLVRRESRNVREHWKNRTPSPLDGEGWDGGGNVNRRSPPPRPSPTTGGGRIMSSPQNP